MARNLPYFRTDTDWNEVSASQMNALVDEVRELSALRASLGVSPSGQLPQALAMSVAVVVKPEVGDDTLTVREIAHKFDPPRPGDIVQRGPKFVAYPDHNVKVTEYDHELGNVDENTTVYRLRNEHSLWIVEKAAGKEDATAVTGAWVIGKTWVSEHPMIYELDTDLMVPRSTRMMQSPDKTPRGCGGDRTTVYTCGAGYDHVYMLDAATLTLRGQAVSIGIPKGIGGDSTVCWYAGFANGVTRIYKLDPLSSPPFAVIESFDNPGPDTNDCGGIGGTADVIYYLDQNDQRIYYKRLAEGGLFRYWNVPRPATGEPGLGTPSGVGGDLDTVYYCDQDTSWESSMFRCDPNAPMSGQRIKVLAEGRFQSLQPWGIGGVTP